MRRAHYRSRTGIRGLRRDPYHKRLGGVCAGLANYLEVKAFYVRAATLIAFLIAPYATLIAYGLAYLVLDDDVV